MKRLASIATAAAALLLCGCPAPVDESDAKSGFEALYASNCASCHGEKGKNGAAMALNNPGYLAMIPPAELRDTIAAGRPGTPMPAFSRTSGGMLADGQIDAIVAGMRERWMQPRPEGGDSLPPYRGEAAEPARGEEAFARRCGGCHGPHGAGGRAAGSVVDPAFLALVSDQSLRVTVLAGGPGGCSGLRGPGAVALSAAESAGEADAIVSWLASHRDAALFESRLNGGTAK